MHRGRRSGHTFLPELRNLALPVSRATSGSGGPRKSSALSDLGRQVSWVQLPSLKLGIHRVQEKPPSPESAGFRSGLGCFKQWEGTGREEQAH